MALRSLTRRFIPGAAKKTERLDVGSWACPAELRSRWSDDAEGNSPIDELLERLRKGGSGAESIADLRGASLAGRDLSGLDLSGADLRGADLTRAQLKRTRLFQARLSGAVLFEACLDDADLTGADLHGASLEGISAHRAGFGRTVLNGVRAIGADFSDAVLTGSQCVQADFRGATLTRARLRECDLSGAEFAKSSMQAAELSNSTVDGACFESANLRESEIRGLVGYETGNWIGVDLRDVDFSGAYMVRRFVMDQNFIEEFRNRDRLHKVIHWAWWASSDCGRSMLRWSVCTAIWVSLFTCLNLLVAIDYGDHSTWLSPFYFTVVTVTTLGYGDALPTSVMAQVLVIFQVSLGYMMLGGLISILSNKLARRAE